MDKIVQRVRPVPPGFKVSTYLGMLQLHAVHQTVHLQPHIILKQDGAPFHWDLPMRAKLHEKFLGK